MQWPARREGRGGGGGRGEGGREEGNGAYIYGKKMGGRVTMKGEERRRRRELSRPCNTSPLLRRPLVAAC